MKTNNLHRTLATGVAGLALTAGVLAGTRPAEAAEYSYRIVGKEQKVVIDLSGDIEGDETAHMTAWAARVLKPRDLMGNVVAVVLNSSGGNVDGALQLGALVRQMNWRTGVAAGGMCASACAVVWAAGVARSVAPDALVGVHSASKVFVKETAGGTITNKTGQASTTGNIKMGSALLQYGMTEGIVYQMTITPPSSMYWLTTGDYAALGAKVSW